jgi:hypothetical protein
LNSDFFLLFTAGLYGFIWINTKSWGGVR